MSSNLGNQAPLFMELRLFQGTQINICIKSVQFNAIFFNAILLFHVDD